jgi:hypothetical protein
MKHLIQATLCLLVLSLSLTRNTLAQRADGKVIIHPVILVHGLGGNASNYWSDNTILDALRKEGYDMELIKIFAYPDNANGVEDGTASILDSAAKLKDDIDELSSLSVAKGGSSKVNIVAHSLGGLITRQYLKEHPKDHNICRFIDLATPHQGSLPIQIFNALPKEMQPGLKATIDSIMGLFGFGPIPDVNTAAAQQLIPKNEVLVNLNKGPSPKDVQYRMLYGDIQIQAKTKLFWFDISSRPVAAGDLLVSSENAAKIPNIDPSGSDNYDYEAITFKIRTTLQFVTNILPTTTLWEARIDGPVDGYKPYWHNGLLSNQEVNQKILSILNKDLSSPCNLKLALPPTPTPTATVTSTPTNTPTATTAPTNTPEPVSSLNGTVTQRSQCRYGPSQYHLFKTGFRPDAPVEVIGRDADGDWLQIQLRGSDQPCWINASLVQVEGDVMMLPDTYPTARRLPLSDAFPQITLISASPVGNGVTASWGPVEIRIDLQQTDAVKYIIEVWTCVDGQPSFYAVGTDDTIATFQIDNSCGIASYAHVIGQDEHGFSFPTNIPLP